MSRPPKPSHKPIEHRSGEVVKLRKIVTRAEIGPWPVAGRDPQAGMFFGPSGIAAIRSNAISGWTCRSVHDATVLQRTGLSP